MISEPFPNACKPFPYTCEPFPSVLRVVPNDFRTMPSISRWFPSHFRAFSEWFRTNSENRPSCSERFSNDIKVMSEWFRMIFEQCRLFPRGLELFSKTIFFVLHELFVEVPSDLRAVFMWLPREFWIKFHIGSDPFLYRQNYSSILWTKKSHRAKILYHTIQTYVFSVGET